jgi:translation initiation factor 1
MAQGKHKTVLFLGAGNDSGGRLAEGLFNAVAGRMGLPWRAGSPAQVTLNVLEAADRVIALGRDDPLPLLRKQFPTWAGAVELWNVDDAPEAPARIEREVMGLVARILGGSDRPDPPAPEPTPASAGKAAAPRGKPIVVKVGRETAGRRGKGVTTVSDLPLDEGGLRDLAATLKQRCGTGGTVRDGRIEVQGDQRERIAAELTKLGYKVKRAGG